jgi:hypothetical protein
MHTIGAGYCLLQSRDILHLGIGGHSAGAYIDRLHISSITMCMHISENVSANEDVLLLVRWVLLLPRLSPNASGHGVKAHLVTVCAITHGPQSN